MNISIYTKLILSLLLAANNVFAVEASGTTSLSRSLNKFADRVDDFSRKDNPQYSNKIFLNIFDRQKDFSGYNGGSYLISPQDMADGMNRLVSKILHPNINSNVVGSNKYNVNASARVIPVYNNTMYKPSASYYKLKDFYNVDFNDNNFSVDNAYKILTTPKMLNERQQKLRILGEAMQDGHIDIENISSIDPKGNKITQEAIVAKSLAGEEIKLIADKIKDELSLINNPEYIKYLLPILKKKYYIENANTNKLDKKIEEFVEF
jgi:archaellum component FlaG (FlaF/FlaG flagellin family)